MSTPDDLLFEEWMNVYGTDVLRTAFFYVKDYSTAEDIFQEVFFKTYKKMNTYRGAASIKTWIVKITVNQCKDYFKSSWFKRVSLFSDIGDNVQVEPDIYSDPESMAQLHKEKQELFEQVLKLSLPLREVLILFIVCNITSLSGQNHTV